MITPSFGLSATERVLPRLALDFTTASLDPRVTFARALNTATRVNSSGLIETVNADLPRFDYDPVTKICKGLLIEESRTNNLLYSQSISTSTGWSTIGGNLTANNAVSPDGTTNASLFSNTAGDPSLLFQSISVTPSSTNDYYASVFVKRNGAANGVTLNIYYPGNAEDNVNFNFDDLSVGGVPYPNEYIFQSFGNGWYRIGYRISRDSTGTIGTIVFRLWIRFRSFGVIGDECYVWGAQLEAGAFPTSYIPTTTTSLTRNADVATMTGTNFSNWFDRLRGAFLAETSTMSFAANRALWAVGDPTLAFGSSETMFAIYSSSAAGAIQFNSFDGGALQASLTPAVAQTINVKTKSVFAYALNNYGASVSASAVTTGAGSLPTETAMSIGSLVSGWNGATQYLNGHIAKLFYYAPRITNAEVQAFSK